MASLDDLLTTTKNIVTALNNDGQININLAGTKNAPGIVAQSLVSTNAGRVVVVSVIVAGSSTGLIYDASSISTATSQRLIAAIPNTVGVFTLNMPVLYGIVVTPGTGMTVAISYS